MRCGPWGDAKRMSSRSIEYDLKDVLVCITYRSQDLIKSFIEPQSVREDRLGLFLLRLYAIKYHRRYFFARSVEY